MEWSNEHLVAKLASILQESRKARAQLSARLRELETEADSVRAELAELDIVVSQSEASLYRRLSSVWPTVMYRLTCRPTPSSRPPCTTNSALRRECKLLGPRRRPPQVRNNVEAVSDLLDRTIRKRHAVLREEGAPLHVNEVYNRLKEGGFKFTGQNPPSVSVSLNQGLPQNRTRHLRSRHARRLKKPRNLFALPICSL